MIYHLFGLTLEKLGWKVDSDSTIAKSTASGPSPKHLSWEVEGRDWICCLYIEPEIVLLPSVFSFKDLAQI